jgi:hypothetical protein
VQSETLVDAGLLGRRRFNEDLRQAAELGHQRVDVRRCQPIGSGEVGDLVSDHFPLGAELAQPWVHDGGIGTGFDGRDEVRGGLVDLAEPNMELGVLRLDDRPGLSPAADPGGRRRVAGGGNRRSRLRGYARRRLGVDQLARRAEPTVSGPEQVDAANMSVRSNAQQMLLRRPARHGCGTRSRSRLPGGLTCENGSRSYPPTALLGCSSTDDRYYFPNTRYIGSSGDFAPTFTVSDLSEDTMLVRYPLVENDEERQLQQGAGRVTPLAMAACPRTPGQRSSGSSAAATWR